RIRLLVQGEAAAFQGRLDVAHVFEGRQRLLVGIPTRIEGERVLLEEALEKADRGRPVLHDEPLLVLVSSYCLESQLLVELARLRDIFHREAHGEISELERGIASALGKQESAEAACEQCCDESFHGSSF